MSEITNERKWQISVLSGLIFLLISSPVLYSLTNSLFQVFGITLANENGCPTIAGLVIHTFVFVLVTRLLMG